LANAETPSCFPFLWLWIDDLNPLGED